ncbi:MAG: shikimate dehydrogenase [Odoribacter sp.]|nr:shikimate dehydrogenase [Odoribacter sp.]
MKIYGIIGYPLGHSFSQKYFTEKFEKENIDAQYLKFEISSIAEITSVLEGNDNLAGFNVTIPYKQQIIPYLNELSPEATKIGAVNCVKIENKGGKKKLTGYNTDACGFHHSLINFIPNNNVTHALILGNGGAAKAVRYVIDNLGIKSLTVSRTPSGENEISYDQVKNYIPTHKLIINTSPLGTSPNVESCPDIPYELLSSEHYLFDLVYNPEITKFMSEGEKMGAHTKNGFEMLIGQAEEAWKKWK